MKLRKKILIGAMGGLMCLSLAACGSQNVATTNGGKVTRTSFYNKMKNTETGHEILKQMIVNKILAKDYGKDVKTSQVNALLNQTKAQYGPSFSMQLQEQGMTVNQYRNTLRSELLLRQAVKHYIDFTPSMLKKQFKSFEPKVTVDQILVPSQSKAQDIEAKLKSGDSFASLAKKYSQGPSSKEGGRLAAFDNTAPLSSKLKDTIFDLDEGEYTKTPIHTQDGYQIFKMVNKPEKGTYKDNKSALEDQITDKKMKNSTFTHKVIAHVLQNGDLNIQDNSLKNIFADYMSSSNN